MAVSTNLEFYTGEDKEIAFTVYQDDGTTEQDITGWSLSWIVKYRSTDSDAAAKIVKTTSAGIVLTTPSDGVCTVSVNDTDTNDLRDVMYLHELKRTDAGAEAVLATGRLKLIPALHGA